MKDLKDFINEHSDKNITEGSKHFKLETDERNSLAEVIGYILGNIGEDEDIKKFDIIMKQLSKEEFDQLQSLYDCLDDEETYPTINRNIIIDDIELIKKVINMINDAVDAGDLNLDDNLSYDLSDVLDKIS